MIPEFKVEMLDKIHLYSYSQKQKACEFAFAFWRKCLEDGDQRTRFVLCEPPALKEA